MDRKTKKILQTVAEKGEISLRNAIQIGTGQHNNHLDQYPLALLLEGGYLGMTVGHTPPQGADEMREFSLATSLHIFHLPRKEDGNRHYMGIISAGSIDPKNERCFLKAKGALYLAEENKRRADRIYSLIIGCILGFLTAVLTAWLESKLNLIKTLSTFGLI